MNFANKEKFDCIIDKLVGGSLTCEEIINHLNVNRFKFLTSDSSQQHQTNKVELLDDNSSLSDLSLNQVG